MYMYGSKGLGQSFPPYIDPCTGQEWPTVELRGSDGSSAYVAAVLLGWGGVGVSGAPISFDNILRGDWTAIGMRRDPNTGIEYWDFGGWKTLQGPCAWENTSRMMHDLFMQWGMAGPYGEIIGGPYKTAQGYTVINPETGEREDWEPEPGIFVPPEEPPPPYVPGTPPPVPPPPPPPPPPPSGTETYLVEGLYFTFPEGHGPPTQAEIDAALAAHHAGAPLPPYAAYGPGGLLPPGPPGGNGNGNGNGAPPAGTEPEAGVSPWLLGAGALAAFLVLRGRR